MERIELLDGNEEDYLEYRVIHEDGTEGSADLRVRELRESSMVNNLKDENLPNDAKIAELFLYPHSETSLRRTSVSDFVRIRVNNPSSDLRSVEGLPRDSLLSCIKLYVGDGCNYGGIALQA